MDVPALTERAGPNLSKATAGAALQGLTPEPAFLLSYQASAG
jgi:hypothetical protein